MMQAVSKVRSFLIFSKPDRTGWTRLRLPLVLLKKLQKIEQKRSVPGGELLFDSRRVPDDLLILEKGKAGLFAADRDTADHLIRLLEINEIVGLTESIADLKPAFVIKTITRCEFEAIPRAQFKGLLTDDNKFRLGLLKALARVIHEWSFIRLAK